MLNLCGWRFAWIAFVGLMCIELSCAVSMQQFEQSLDMMRNGCLQQHKVQIEILDKMRAGQFTDESQDVKCYARCVAKLAGTLTKKGEFSVQKALAQIPIILPSELHDVARQSLEACKDVQKNYKDSCDRVYYLTKCVAEHDPANFKFP